MHPQNYDRNTKDTFPCCGAAEKVPLYKKDISLGFLNIPIFLLFSKNFGCIYLNHSGERSVRIREVESSSLFRSTIVVVNCTGSRRLFYWQLHLRGYMARSKRRRNQIPASFLHVLMGMYLSAQPDWGSSGARSGRSVRRPGIFRGRPGSGTY